MKLFEVHYFKEGDLALNIYIFIKIFLSDSPDTPVLIPTAFMPTAEVPTVSLITSIEFGFDGPVTHTLSSRKYFYCCLCCFNCYTSLCISHGTNAVFYIDLKNKHKMGTRNKKCIDILYFIISIKIWK